MAEEAENELVNLTRLELASLSLGAQLIGDEDVALDDDDDDDDGDGSSCQGKSNKSPSSVVGEGWATSSFSTLASSALDLGDGSTSKARDGGDQESRKSRKKDKKKKSSSSSSRDKLKKKKSKRRLSRKGSARSFDVEKLTEAVQSGEMTKEDAYALTIDRLTQRLEETEVEKAQNLSRIKELEKLCLQQEEKIKVLEHYFRRMNPELDSDDEQPAEDDARQAYVSSSMNVVDLVNFSWAKPKEQKF